MTLRPRSFTPPRSRSIPWQLWLDVMAIMAWGILLIKFWLTSELNLLLHPDYMWLAQSAGVFLIGLGLFKAWQAWQQGRQRVVRSTPLPHFALLPPGWGSAVLLAVAVFGLQFTPKPFSSSMAIDRGVTETLAMTRSQPQSFRGGTRPEDRSLIDWVRTLNVYPEPDAYAGQKVNIEGFVTHVPDLPAGYFMISRFVITCCAADVYPVGLPVKLPEGAALPAADTWLRLEGSMFTSTYAGQRHLAIAANGLTEIPAPINPYDY